MCVLPLFYLPFTPCAEIPSEWHHNVILRSRHTPGCRPWSVRMRGIALGTFYVFHAELHEQAGAIKLRNWTEDSPPPPPAPNTPPYFGVSILRLFGCVCADSNYRDSRYHVTVYSSFWRKSPCLILLNNVKDITQKVILILSILTSVAEDTILAPLSFAVDRC